MKIGTIVQAVLTVIVVLILLWMISAATESAVVDIAFEIVLYGAGIALIIGILWAVTRVVAQHLLLIIGAIAILAILWLAVSLGSNKIGLKMAEAEVAETRAENSTLRGLIDLNFGGEELVAKAQKAYKYKYTYWACLAIAPLLGFISGVAARSGNKIMLLISAFLAFAAAGALFAGVSCSITGVALAGEVVTAVGALSPKEALLVGAPTVGMATEWASALYAAISSSWSLLSLVASLISWLFGAMMKIGE